ncbi:MAG: ADP-ribosylglycohydrolase family protein [Lachnospiraceae bacterium]|nr:ADP-ribosylglycohydrolase family protein [Lachnospiraceae bacterium]
MKGKKQIGVGLSVILFALSICLSVKFDTGIALAYESEEVSAIDLPENSVIISLDEYRDKVKGGIAGTMAGVAYGYADFETGQQYEFCSKDWISEENLPSWENKQISNGYDQDDVYLSMTAIEAFSELGLDVESRELGIYMYNKGFEFWDGSNNDVLARGFAPPYSGYPKQATGYYTNAFSDGNSYQCGSSFAGYLGLNMTGVSNEMIEKVASICCYGDGIYAAQFIAAMYGSAFFTSDINQIIQAGLNAIPSDSWSAQIIQDVLDNKEAGLSAERNYEAIMQKWVYGTDEASGSEYQWIEWPNDLLLDAKVCSAFTVIGLLYGEGDIEKSTKLTVQCANDCDSTAAATAGILSVISGWDGLETQIKDGVIDTQYFKYTQSTIDDIVDQCVELVQEIVLEQGGQVVSVDGVLSLVIPESATVSEIEAYQCGKTVTQEELGEPIVYSEEEMAQLRYISEPGFETCQKNGVAGSLTNGWSVSDSSATMIECMEQTAYTGLSNVKLTAIQGETVVLKNVTTRSLEANTNYTLTCMVQGNSDFMSQTELTVWNSEGLKLRSQVCEVTEDWKQVTLTFNTGNFTDFQIGIQLTGENDSDYIRLDDFVVSPVL